MGDIPVKRNVTLKARWEVRNRETKELVDVTSGYTVKCVIKPISTSATTLLELTAGSGITLGNGWVEVILSDVQTQGLALGYNSRAWYLVTVKDNGTGEVDEVDSGKLIFSG